MLGKDKDEDYEDIDDIDSVESYSEPASPEYSDVSTVDYNAPPFGIEPPGPSIQPSPLNTRSGKAKKTKKDREPFYKGFGVVYLPGDINGLAKKLHLLSAEFFAGNTSVGNELVPVLNALLRLKQLTRKEYADITTRLAAYYDCIQE